MDLIRSGLRSPLKECARDIAELRVVIAGSDLEFLQGVRIGVDHRDSQNVTVVLGAVQLEAIRVKVLPVNVHLKPALRVFAGGVLKAIKLSAGKRQHQGGQVTVEDRELFHFLGAEPGTDIRAIGLKQRSLRRDRDSAGGPTDLQLPVNASCGIDADRRGGNELGKSGSRYLYFIAAREQMGLRVIPVRVCLGLESYPTVKIGDQHIRAGNGCTARIRHSAGDITGHGLPEHRSAS